MTTPQIRLSFGAIFWRIFLIAFVLSEIATWNLIRQRFPGVWKPQRIPWLLYHTPRSAFGSFLIAAVVTVVLDQLVRLIAGPLVARWYHPLNAGASETPLGFHLNVGESVVAEAPARRRAGRGWRPGTLVLTGRTLWFFPIAWDLEPWSRPVEEVRLVGTMPYRPLFGTFVRGVPDRLIVRDADGVEESFALADPSSVLDWFRGSVLTRSPLDHPLPTPAESPDA